MPVEQGDRIRLVSDVVDDTGTVHREGEKGDVVGLRGFTHAVVVFNQNEYALVEVIDLIVDHKLRRS